MSRSPVVVGVADVPLSGGKARPGSSVLSIQRDAAIEALSMAGLSMRDVDAVAIAGTWGIPGPGIMMPTVIVEYLGLEYPRFIDGSNIGGAAFVQHAGHMAEALRAGEFDVGIILYGSLQKSEGGRTLGGRPAFLSNQFEIVAGLPTPVGGFALAASRHFHQYGSGPETLARIAVAARKWAALNPAATYRAPLSVEEVLKSQMICDPLHLLDCCLVTDGGGAVVITTEERARDLRMKPLHILGHGETATHSSVNYMPDMARLEGAERSSKRALAMAGRKVSDIDLLMCYDSFTITVLLTLEALGFCEPGEGKDFIQDGRIEPGGSLPMNTSGGGLSYCHPGMYSLFTMTEAAKQLWGLCGERQVRNARTAMCHGTGGMLGSTATLVLSTERE